METKVIPIAAWAEIQVIKETPLGLFRTHTIGTEDGVYNVVHVPTGKALIQGLKGLAAVDAYVRELRDTLVTPEGDVWAWLRWDKPEQCHPRVRDLIVHLVVEFKARGLCVTTEDVVPADINKLRDLTDELMRCWKEVPHLTGKQVEEVVTDVFGDAWVIANKWSGGSLPDGESRGGAPLTRADMRRLVRKVEAVMQERGGSVAIGK